jgi:hypothetical protein
VPGDAPSAPGLLAAHAAADGVAVGAIDGDAAPTSWTGLRPVDVPPAPVRHVSLPRTEFAAVEGVDERLPDLEVAVTDLLARMAGAHVTRLSCAIRPAAGDARVAAAVTGRSSQALDTLCLTRGDAVLDTGSSRSRAALRWVEPLLARGPGSRARRLALRAAFARGRGRPPLLVEPHDRAGLPAPLPEERPAVAVVVPFAGSAVEGRALLDALAEIRRRPGDEIVVADNSREPVLEPREGIAVVRADAEWSSYHARNVAWPATTAPWILFTDGDCRPSPDILERYFAPMPADGVGAVGGAVFSAPPGDSAVERWSSDVDVLSQARTLAHPYRPFAVTANLLVRRDALAAVGGFAEGIRSGGDVDLCWRLQEAGWTLEFRPRAAVEHRHRTTLRGVIRQYRRYGGGIGWIGQRYAGSGDGWLAVEPHMFGDPVAALLAGRFEYAATLVLNLATTVAARRGGRAGNAAPRP